jgi:hypothetical protein
MRLVLGEAKDGISRVASEPWETPRRLGILWKLRAILSHQHAGGLMQIASSAVIAEPLPGRTADSWAAARCSIVGNRVRNASK